MNFLNIFEDHVAGIFGATRAPFSFKKLAKEEDVSEDEIKQLEDQAQKMTDKYIADVDRAVEAKTKEILTV